MIQPASAASPKSTCPQCCEDNGEPYAVKFSSGMRTLSLHCLSCGHSWHVTEHDRTFAYYQVRL